MLIEEHSTKYINFLNLYLDHITKSENQLWRIIQHSFYYEEMKIMQNQNKKLKKSPDKI